MLTLMIMMACGGSAEKPDGESETAVDLSGWTGGDFDFQTVSVDDGCLSGAFEALFMPDGPATPHNFGYPIYIPSYADLPENYSIDLRDPFVEMPVNVDSADGLTYSIRGSVMESVELGSSAYGDCVVTMSVDADLTPVTLDMAEGSAEINISDARGSDDLCPVFESDTCVVSLGLSATR